MDSQSTLDVIFHGNKMGTIDKLWFGQNSQRYLQMLLSRDAPNRIEIQAPVTPASVQEFISVCNGHQMNLTLGNVLDLHLLLEDWQIPPLLETANQYIERYPQLLPERISRGISQQRSTDGLEVLLRRHFVELCRVEASHAALRNLGIGVLMRVFEANNHELVRCHLHDVFPFLLSCLRDQKIGSLASMLFHGTMIDALTDEEIDQLSSEKNMDFDGLNRGYFDLVKESRSLRRMCKELREVMQQQRQEIQSLRADVNALKQRPVVSCECQESRVTVSCRKCGKAMHVVPDYVYGQKMWECRLSRPPFDGIFSEMRKKCGGNPHLRGLVAITSSGDFRNHCWQVIDPDWNDYYQTTNVLGSFIQIDFKQSKVLLEGYSVLLCPPGNGWATTSFPEWVIEISDDHITWTVVGVRMAVYSYPGEVASFELGNPRENRVCRYVRFRDVTRDNYFDHYLAFRRIEVFGRLTT